MTTQRLWLFRLIGLLIPVVFFALAEGILRLAGFGQPVPLFIDNPAQPAYQLARPDILSRYFPTGYAPRVKLEPTFFLKDKPANGFRVVIQGGSTAAGFPYGVGASLAGMLDQRLKQSLPANQVEVINTAMSAVNSYQLLDVADDIIAIKPDAVVIYAGHNEYLGIFGIGSNFQFGGRWLTQTYFALHDLALVQALQQLLVRITAPTADSQQDRTFMSQVAKNTNIPLHSDVYEQGLAQFEGNMQALLDKYQRAGIPVYLCTLASNLKDQPPFASDPLPSDWQSPENLIAHESDIAKSSNANALYALATWQLSQGQFKAAKQTFTKARDNDLLRFRAPSDINTLIRQLALKPGVTLIESQQAMAQRSPNGIIGNNLMLEHLHPNLPGYFVLADSVYQQLIKHPALTQKHVISTDTAWQMRPVIAAEEYFGFAQIQALKSDYPFSSTPQPLRLPTPDDWQQHLGLQYFEKQIDWLTMMRLSLARYQQENNHFMVAKVTQILADALPQNALYNQQTAEYMQASDRKAESRYYAQRARLSGALAVSGLE